MNRPNYRMIKKYMNSTAIAMANILMMSGFYTIYAIIKENNKFNLFNAITISTASSMIVFTSLVTMHKFIKVYSRKFALISFLTSFLFAIVSCTLYFFVNFHIQMLNMFKDWNVTVFLVNAFNYASDVLKNYLLFILVSTSVHLFLVPILVYLYKFVRSSLAKTYMK